MSMRAVINNSHLDLPTWPTSVLGWIAILALPIFSLAQKTAQAETQMLGACKRDFSAEGLYAMMFFIGWSHDSSRLLIRLKGGEEKKDMANQRDGFVYFNTRSGKFEVTDYLRKLNHTKSEVLGCAEPTDPLPDETDLKARLERLDSQLNKTFGEVIAKTRKENVSAVRDEERDWIKQRDQGVTLYVSLFPQGERERRRLQFLGDVTAARIEDFPTIEQNYS